MKKVEIRGIDVYFPTTEITNEEIEKRIGEGGVPLPKGILESIMGCKTRYYAAPEEQASDLAANAAKKVLEKADNPKVDLLIFASACADLIEPATSNIVQYKLGLQCPVFDLKNACNSVANAMEIGSALIASGVHENILIVSGEKPSDSIKYSDLTKDSTKAHFASFSFGDAGVAVLLSPSADESGFIFHKNISYGQHWQLCTIPGGGSMHPHDATKLYFSGETFALKAVFEKHGTPFVNQCLKEAGISISDIDLICTHQVSKNAYNDLANNFNFDINKIVKTFHLFGNTAASSLPIAYHYAITNNLFKKGDLVMLLGMAAGINISVQILRA